MNHPTAHLDANELGFLKRELETVQSTVYETEFAELKAFKLFPIINEGRFEDNIITYRQTDKTGTASIIGDNVDDLPRVDVKRSEYHNPNRVIANSFAYTVREIRAASKLGRNLNASMAVAAREAQEQLINRVAFFGDKEYGLTGLLTPDNGIPRYVVKNGASGSRPWSSKTPDEILHDLNEITIRLQETTLGIETPDTLLLPIRKHSLIATKRIVDINTTILEFFLRNNPFIKNVEWAHELHKIGQDNEDVMVAYKRDVNKLALNITHPFEILPEQRNNLEFRYPCISSTAGLILYRPKSLLIAEKI